MSRVSLPVASRAPTDQIPSAAMDDAEQEIYKKYRKLVFKLSNFDERDIDKETVLTYDTKLTLIEEIHEDLVESIQKLVIDHGSTMGQPKATEWQAHIGKIQDDVRSHRRKITKKVTEVKSSKSQPVDTTSRVEAENLDLMQQLEIYKQIGPPETSKSILSPEDSEFAEKHQKGEIETVDEEDLYEEDLDEEDLDEDDLDEEDLDDIYENVPEDEVFDNKSDKDGVSEECDTIKIGEIVMHPKLDLLEVPFPELHFSKEKRGRLLVGTQVFEGSFMDDLEKYVTKKLTRRRIFRKIASVLDTGDKCLPILAGLKIDSRQADIGTRLGCVPDSDEEDLLYVFDDAVPDERNAAPLEINQTTAVDAAKQIKGDIDDATAQGIQTPPRDLCPNDEEESFEECLGLEKPQEFDQAVL